MADLNEFKKKLNKSQPDNAVNRDRVIIRTSVIGIAANVLLAVFKAVVGVISNSIAVILDAVNNISDAASSVITIVGTKLAGKAPDKKHPFGHGRVEYVSAMIISVIVLYAGITSLQESVKKIINPEASDYSAVTLIIIGVAVIVKLVLGRFVKQTGIRVNSDSLINSGTDAALDAVISAATLAAAVTFMLTGVSLEAWLAAVISLVIIKSGIDMLRETISKILGERADASLAKKIKETVCSFPDVTGAYDLVLNNYGPDVYNGSLHIEIPDTYSASELDELLRDITVKVYNECHVILTAIGVYSINTSNEEVAEIRETVTEIVLAHKNVLQIHGFFADAEKKKMRFDLVISFDEKNRGELYETVVSEVLSRYPDYTLDITMDTDFSESE